MRNTTNESFHTNLELAPPPAPRITSRLVLLVAVWSFAVLSTGSKTPLEATPQAAVPQVAVRVMPSAAMAQFMAVRHVAVSANVSVTPATTTQPQIISVVVDAQPKPRVQTSTAPYVARAEYRDHRVVSTR